MSDEASNGDEPADNSSPFQRFERLTKRLMSVPKAEIDAARRKQKRRPKPLSRKRRAV